jgi:hypothetical protein
MLLQSLPPSRLIKQPNIYTCVLIYISLISDRRSNTIVLNGAGEMAVRRPRIIKRPSKRRSNECLGSSHTETDTDDEIYENKNMSLFGVSPAGDNAGDILEKV